MATDPMSPHLMPAEVPIATARPRRSRIYGGLVLVFAGIALYQCISAWKSTHAFLINVSPSLPNWAFVLETKATPARGSLIFFRPPVSKVLVNNFGSKSQLFGKYVEGIAGDVVTSDGRRFFVNGKPVGVAKSHSRRGEPLAAGPTGVIPVGCYYVGTPHKDGFDSRYALIGWICRDRIIGTGVPVL